jgi:hypothetical protein
MSVPKGMCPDEVCTAVTRTLHQLADPDRVKSRRLLTDGSPTKHGMIK